MYKRTQQKELSFAGENLMRGRHKIHPYPAMLHPLLVDFLLEKYANKGDVVFDPFCGHCGTICFQEEME
jgi:site-specific DNA-methyltransferase (cytosine-N4-specific)